MNRLQISRLAATAFALLAGAMALGLAACSQQQNSQVEVVNVSSDLQVNDTVVGTGAEATSGKTLTMHYTGWLYNNGQKGAKFDSSVDRGQPFEFKLGTGQVIRGWDDGIKGMKVGGKRTLIIPPALGYGAQGAGGGLIPPGATLLFDVELLGVR